MSQPTERLEAEALALSARERARLAHRLIASLDDESDTADEEAAEVERAWEEEIRRRLRAYRSGAAQATAASDVFAKARARLR